MSLQPSFSEGIVHRCFEPGDEVEINKAFNQVFGLQRSLEEWSWKLPLADGGRAIMLAVDSQNHVLAQYAGAPTSFHVDGEVIPAAQIVDIFSAPRARHRFSRKGIFVETAKRFFETFAASGRFPLLFGFPGERSLRIGLLQLGYDAVTPQPITYLRRTISLSGRASRATRPAVGRLLYRAEPARDWEPRLDLLWRRARGAYPVSVVRDAQRALIRLAGHPSVRYHRWLIFPRLSLIPVAFVAFRTDQHLVRWVDLLWDHDHPRALDLISHLSAQLARQACARHEELWLSGDRPCQLLLERLGFEQLAEPNGLVLVARSFTDALDVSRLDQRVYLTMADADLV